MTDFELPHFRDQDNNAQLTKSKPWVLREALPGSGLFFWYKKVVEISK